jgi:DNA-directed RNA polymerase subunit alpha
MLENILLPSKLKVAHESSTTGTYEIEGLYPGYGHTLGNSLRRIILSSLPGAAMTSIRIDGVNHEFSTIEGVKEDVIAIILNLKHIRFRIDGTDAQTVTLNVKGPKTVTATDLEMGGQVEVLTKDQYIAEITGKINLKIDIIVERGLGFLPKEMLHKEKVDIGTIAVDAVFTPIRRMNYEVENMRVGDRTDHNRLRLNIETDGSLSPREALERALTIMIAQLKAALDLKHDAEEEKTKEEEKEVEKETVPSASKEDYADILKTRVDTLNVSTRTLNALAEASIRTIGGIVRKTEEDLLAIEGIGNKGVSEIKEMLSQYSLNLKE